MALWARPGSYLLRSRRTWSFVRRSRLSCSSPASRYANLRYVGRPKTLSRRNSAKCGQMICGCLDNGFCACRQRNKQLTKRRPLDKASASKPLASQKIAAAKPLCRADASRSAPSQGAVAQHACMRAPMGSPAAARRCHAWASRGPRVCEHHITKRLAPRPAITHLQPQYIIIESDRRHPSINQHGLLHRSKRLGP